MKPNEDLRSAIAGVGVAIFGLTVSVLAFALSPLGSLNFNDEIILGALIAFLGALVSLYFGLKHED